MKCTLKALLTTTLLTLSTALGSVHLEGAAAVELAQPGAGTDAVDAVDAAKEKAKELSRSLFSSKSTSFDDVVNKLLAIRHEVVEDRVKGIRHAALKDAIISADRFDYTQKIILRWLLPNATLVEIGQAAYNYAHLENKTSAIVDDLYKEFAEHKSTTYDDIQWASRELPDWDLRSEKFFHLLVMIKGKHKRNAIPYTLILALDYMVGQNPDYEKAAILYEYAGSHDDVTAYLAKDAVDRIKELGDRSLRESERVHYYARSDALLAKVKLRFPEYKF
jgi:hypothetical protein